MIFVENVTKRFDNFIALDHLNLHVKKGSIYGLVGTNGAGKTTIIKHITGILTADEGNIFIGGEKVYDNNNVKAKLGYIPDDLSYYASFTLKQLSRFFSAIYPDWNDERYKALISQFNLSEKRKLSRFSKGMQKQAVFSLVMATHPDTLILDEPIDGLDPIVRKIVWKTIVDDVAEREMTCLISSHNLRELENICDSIGILSHGKMFLERDLDELRSDIHKIQIAFSEKHENPFEDLNILHREQRGTIELLIIRDKSEKVEAVLNKSNPIIFDMLPLTLEEIFIYELGGDNCEVGNILS